MILKRFFDFLIIFCFIYQFYDLTNDYLKYEFVIELKAKPTEGIVPAVTICVDSNLEGDFYCCGICQQLSLLNLN